MASRLANSALRASKFRPSLLSPRTVPALYTPISHPRYASNDPSSNSNVPSESPQKRAQTIIDALPGSNLAAKTAILSAGAGISTWAISNELYVLNEETVIAFCLLTVFYGIFSYGGPMYKEWSDNTIAKIKDILNTARRGHADAVKTRIEDVKPLSNVVEITKQLFEVSKETAQLEAQAYELEQRTALATEAKNVLDSWVRHEGQVKARQQKELAESVIAKVQKELENPQFLKKVLDQSVADVERVLSSGGKAA